MTTSIDDLIAIAKTAGEERNMPVIELLAAGAHAAMNIPVLRAISESAGGFVIVSTNYQSALGLASPESPPSTLLARCEQGDKWLVNLGPFAGFALVGKIEDVRRWRTAAITAVSLLVHRDPQALNSTDMLRECWLAEWERQTVTVVRPGTNPQPVATPVVTNAKLLDEARDVLVKTGRGPCQTATLLSSALEALEQCVDALTPPGFAEEAEAVVRGEAVLSAAQRSTP